MAWLRVRRWRRTGFWRSPWPSQHTMHDTQVRNDRWRWKTHTTQNQATDLQLPISSSRSRGLQTELAYLSQQALRCPGLAACTRTYESLALRGEQPSDMSVTHSHALGPAEKPGDGAALSPSEGPGHRDREGTAFDRHRTCRLCIRTKKSQGNGPLAANCRLRCMTSRSCQTNHYCFQPVVAASNQQTLLQRTHKTSGTQELAAKMNIVQPTLKFAHRSLT